MAKLQLREHSFYRADAEETDEMRLTYRVVLSTNSGLYIVVKLFGNGDKTVDDDESLWTVKFWHTQDIDKTAGYWSTTKFTPSPDLRHALLIQAERCVEIVTSAVCGA